MDHDLERARNFVLSMFTHSELTPVEFITSVLSVARHYADIRAMGVCLEKMRR